MSEASMLVRVLHVVFYKIKQEEAEHLSPLGYFFSAHTVSDIPH